MIGHTPGYLWRALSLVHHWRSSSTILFDMKTFLIFLGLFISSAVCAQTPEDRLKELGITLPELSSPAANYVNAVRAGNLLFLAGKGPGTPDGKFITGKLGEDLTVEQGYEAARLTGLSQLAVLKHELGDLSKVKRIVKVLGMVNATTDFTDHPKVTNGFSDLMVQVFGEKGKHARSSVGMCSLPFNIAVEIELVVEIEE